MKRNLWSLLFVASLMSLWSTAAHAVVVPFDIVPDVPVVPAGVIPGGNPVGSPFTYYNIQFTVDGGAADINIRTSRAIDGGTPDQVTSDGHNGSSIVTKGLDSYLNTPFALGDVIGDGLDEAARGADVFNVLNDGGTQNYLQGANYLGLRLTSGNYAYVQVDYDAASSTYTFVGGAYDDSGAPIVAGGVVPEPAAASMMLVACLCGLRASRRRAAAA
jgi:hypothetical protein